MIYLDKTPQQILEQYPCLKSMFPLICHCGIEIKADTMRPYITKDYIGLRSETCDGCSAPGFSVYTFRGPIPKDHWSKEFT